MHMTDSLRKRAFTQIERLVIITIIAILATALRPAWLAAKTNIIRLLWITVGAAGFVPNNPGDCGMFGQSRRSGEKQLHRLSSESD